MKTAIFLLLPCMLLMTGCETIGSRRAGAVRRETDLANLKADVRRLEERVEGVAAAQERIYEQLRDLQQSGDARESEMGDRMRAVEQRLSATESSINAAKKEIVSNLSRKVTEIVGSGNMAGSSRVEEGYEHIVQPGETLSEIASAYNVRVEVIARANGIDNPNSIRVGQKLFIPE